MSTSWSSRRGSKILDLTLFDYELKNDGVDRGRPEPSRRRDRAAEASRRRDAARRHRRASASHDKTIDVNATGDANLGILQGFFRNLRSSGAATLTAGVSGSLDKPVFSGQATISDGRIRHFPMPRSLDAINGTVSFDADGIRVDSDRRGHARRRRGRSSAAGSR